MFGFVCFHVLVLLFLFFVLFIYAGRCFREVFCFLFVCFLLFLFVETSQCSGLCVVVFVFVFVCLRDCFVLFLFCFRFYFSGGYIPDAWQL